MIEYSLDSEMQQCKVGTMPDLSRIQPLRRENLPEIVFEKLCGLILEGRIEPGQTVTVSSLSDALNVSPMPIREAMARLAHIGALTRLSGRSMGVPEQSPRDLAFLRETRLTVEEMAVRQAVKNADKGFLDQLGALLVDMVAAEQADDNLTFINLNYQFHFAIYEQSGNPVLLEIIRNLWLRVSPHFHLLNVRGHLKVSNAIHRKFLKAIETGDTEAACGYLRQDIDRAYEQMIECLYGETR